MLEDEYIALFCKNTVLFAKLFKGFEAALLSEGIPLKDLGTTFTWNLLQEIGYRTEDEARIQHKKNSPDADAHAHLSYVDLFDSCATAEQLKAVQEELKRLSALLTEKIETA